jgi:hypothetical protein
MLAICQSKHPSLKSRELCRDGSSVGPKENGANWLLDRAMATTPREASLRLSPWSAINQRILNPTLPAASSLPTATSQPAVFFLSEQTSHQQPANSTFLSASAKRTACVRCKQTYRNSLLKPREKSEVSLHTQDGRSTTTEALKLTYCTYDRDQSPIPNVQHDPRIRGTRIHLQHHH